MIYYEEYYRDDILMMSIQNLASQENVVVKYIGGIYTEFCLKLWFESDW